VSEIALHRISQTEVVAFGRSRELDCSGTTNAELERLFGDARRTAVASAPHHQGAIDGFTGRVVRLTAEGAPLLAAGKGALGKRSDQSDGRRGRRVKRILPTLGRRTRPSVSGHRLYHRVVAFERISIDGQIMGESLDDGLRADLLLKQI